MMKTFTLFFTLVLLSNIGYAQVQNPQLQRYTDQLKRFGLNNLETPSDFKLDPFKKQASKPKILSGIKEEKRQRVSVEMPVVKPKNNINYSLLVSPTDSTRRLHLQIKDLK